jgi:16S rRNA (guanine527-N7)-methyltransferase
MEIENENLLIEGAKAFSIHLDKKNVEAFGLFLKELLRWNQKINLTAIRTEKEIVLKHFLDSLSLHPYLPEYSSILDIGSGAGFPGIPLKIVTPSLEITLIDSVRKKVDFQRNIIRRLGLKGIKAIHGRAQDSEIFQSLEAQFDITISRAFSDLRTFLLLSFPFLKKDGRAIAMKSGVKTEEIQTLGKKEETRYLLQKTVSFPLPFSSLKRSILLFEKRPSATVQTM